MKIALIGPGIMKIPPEKWGAVEMMIWDYAIILKDLGHRVQIINTPDKDTIKFEVEYGKFDVVHLHYDVFADILKDLVPHCKLLIASTHYPYINTPAMWGRDGYGEHFQHLRENDNFKLFLSSQKDINTYTEFGGNPDNIWMSKLGVRCDPYEFNEYAQYDKTLCFSQVCDRKRQYILEDLVDIDIFGRRESGKFRGKHYLGELPRDLLNKNITNYSNFILLSEIENTTPLVVKEALICGLGLVVSETVAVELDLNKTFIDVIPEDKIKDIEYIQKVVDVNKRMSRQIRKEIRRYGIDTFGLENILAYEYVPKLQSLL
tara:strand:- start:2109 stop:3062 length:954 start_codon:yes stop_codon:yes gene_type:complete